MKRIHSLFLVYFYTVVLFLSGCQKSIGQADITNEPSTTQVPQLDIPADVGSVEWIFPDNDIKMNDMCLFWHQNNIQFSADDGAKLSIYVNTGKDDDGNLVYDDGQDWLVLLETSFGNYPLFARQYVQLGGVSCVVFNDYIENNTISHIIIIVQQTSGYKIYDCIYDSEEEAFMVIPVYDAQAINLITSSPNAK